MINILGLCAFLNLIIAQTPPPCPTAVFPLIFGGSGGDSIMKTFDLYAGSQYKIVAGGYSYDQTIGATTTAQYFPIIIMYKGIISTSLAPFWGKVINAADYQVTGIKIDLKGEYVVAHADHSSNIYSIIIVIRANLVAN